MILITQFWNFKNSKRKEEIYKCLSNNLKNKNISKIYVLMEGNKKVTLKHNKIRQIIVNRRYTYYEMFRLVSDNFKKQKCIIANADIYFDDTLSKLSKYSLSNKILALSNDGGSIDAWIMDHTSKIPKSNFKFGEAYNDLRTLKVLLENNIRVINPSKDIRYIEIDSFKSLSKFPYDGELPNISPDSLSSTSPSYKYKKLNEGVDIFSINTKRKKINKKKISKDTKKNKEKLAIVIHLYYQDLWSEFETLLENLDGYNYDLYVTLTDNSSTLGQTLWIKSKVEDFGGKVFILPNKGLDIGPFLYVIDYILNEGYSYDYLLKLHTKKSIETAGYDFGRNWRMSLLIPLIGSENIVDKNIKKLKNSDIGMLGSQKWVSNHKNGNDDWIRYYRNKLNIKGGDTFIGGTMFWVKWNILSNHFNKFNSVNIYNELESDYFHDHNGSTKTHSLERIFGYMVQSDNKLIVGV